VSSSPPGAEPHLQGLGEHQASAGCEARGRYNERASPSPSFKYKSRMPGIPIDIINLRKQREKARSQPQNPTHQRKALRNCMKRRNGSNGGGGNSGVALAATSERQQHKPPAAEQAHLVAVHCGAGFHSPRKEGEYKLTVRRAVAAGSAALAEGALGMACAATRALEV
jgi:hypothetical protein